jgi:hypothetical protein
MRQGEEMLWGYSRPTLMVRYADSSEPATTAARSISQTSTKHGISVDDSRLWPMQWCYDGQYGTAVQYVSGDPMAFGGGNQPASATVAFGAAADVTALAFTLRSDGQASTIDVSVNGSAFGPLAVTSSIPTTFFGATDNSGPITSITFTALNFGELDVINSYAVGSAVASTPPPRQAR